MFMQLFYIIHMYTIREPQTVSDCINKLRKINNFVMPSGDSEWFDFDRQDIDIRRSHIL